MKKDIILREKERIKIKTLFLIFIFFYSISLLTLPTYGLKQLVNVSLFDVKVDYNNEDIITNFDYFINPVEIYYPKTQGFFTVSLDCNNDDFFMFNISLNQGLNSVLLPICEGTLRIFYIPTQQLVLDEKIVFCNYNNKCDNKENMLICSDCTQKDLDKYCHSEYDDICDPDCGAIDLDCFNQEAYKLPEEKEKKDSNSFLLTLLAILVLTFVLIVFLTLRKKQNQIKSN